MSNTRRDYDSTVARIAGNIMSGMAKRVFEGPPNHEDAIVRWTVNVARAIVAETRRTEPKPE